MHKVKKWFYGLLLLLVVLMVVCGISIASIKPSVPESSNDLQRELRGYILVECLNSHVTLCGIELPDASEPTILTSHCEDDCEWANSISVADERKVVYVQQPKVGDDTIWSLSLGKPLPELLVAGAAPKWQPIWSPDGQYIAYGVRLEPYNSPRRSGSVTPTPMLTSVPHMVSYRYSALHILDLHTGHDIRITPEQVDVLEYAWSQSGQQLAVSGRFEDSNQDGRIAPMDEVWLYIISLPDYTITRVKETQVAEYSRRQPSWSADGQYLAYLGNDDDLVVLDATTYDEIVRFEISAGAKAYRWAPERAQIAYIGYSRWPESVHLFEDLFIFDLTTGTHTRLTDTHNFTVFGCYYRNGIQLDHPTWSPDSKHIAFMWRTEDQEYLVVSNTDGTQLSQVMKLDRYYRLVDWLEGEN
jgi:Tol biopolymer transport system component